MTNTTSVITREEELTMAKNKDNKMKKNRDSKMPESNMEVGKQVKAKNKNNMNMEMAEDMKDVNNTKNNQ